MSNSSAEHTRQARENQSNRPTLEYKANNRTLALVLLSMGVLGVAMVSTVIFASVTILTRQGTLPSMVTVWGSINLNGTVKDPSITLIDVANSQHHFSASIASSSYLVTVPNGHGYYIQIYYTIPTNNCYTNQAGNYVCLQLPGLCFRGPIEVNIQANIMRYDLDCNHK